MSRLRTFGPALIITAALTVFIAPAAGADAAQPVWSVQTLAAPTRFAPGDESGLDTYESFFVNSGGGATDRSAVTIVDTLPEGIEVESVELQSPRAPIADLGEPPCETQTTGEVATVTCVITESVEPEREPALLYPDDQLRLAVHVKVPAVATNVELTNRVEVEGGGAEPAAAEIENVIDPECATVRECAPPGFEEFRAAALGPDGDAADAADSHPYEYVTTAVFNVNPAPPGSGQPFLPAGGDLKDIEVALPPGLVGNPMVGERCTSQQFNSVNGTPSPSSGALAFPNECPSGSAVGLVTVQQLEGAGGIIQAPLYNLVPPRGMPAQLGFQIAGVPIYIDAKLRSDGDYGVSAFVHNAPQAKRVTAVRVAIWGDPADESHDAQRGICAQLGVTASCPPAPGEQRPFMRLPSSCQSPLLSSLAFNSWLTPTVFHESSSSAPAPLGCAVPDFSPGIEAETTTSVADSPTGLHVDLHVPQAEHEEDEIGEADLRDATVTLPPGLLVNPASAAGLAACTPQQIGLATVPGARPIRFDESPVTCPPASKLGRIEVDTPLLDHPVPGAIYLASQGNNPFNSLIAVYIAIEDDETGVVAKLAGKVSPDPVTGQLSTTFEENPQLPVEDIKLDLFEGPRASLRTPAACGSYTLNTFLVPWTAPEGATAIPSSSFSIGAGPAGPCPSGALAPKLSAGLANPAAGAYSPFSLRLTREDGTGEFAALTTSPPPGLLARLAGIPYCPEESIAHAVSRSAPGQGALEAADPSCPAASRVGTTIAGAGAGPSPFFTDGEVYLAGPYKGAPVSLVAIIPALAGPFDLGAVTVRVAVRIDPETAQVSAVADPLPMILAGIPLDLRDVRVVLDRPDFTLAPTNCEPKSVTASVESPSGQSATASDRFQVDGCRGLGFKPRLSLKLSGGTGRTRHPALRAVLSYPKHGAYANVAAASVALPHSEFLAQEHIRTICTRVQFAADSCPRGAIYGKARAISPLLDAPLEGPVYLRSSNHPLPDLVADLKGQVEVVVVGRIDSHNGGIRTSFEAVPDAPVSKFILEMPGGKKGLLVNSRNICGHRFRATARFSGQNGKTFDSRPLLRSRCSEKSKK
jgi:hypothetical protein